MKNSLLFWQLSGFLFTGVVGVLLHFLYDWSSQSAFVAPFSAVNESIWEHMKLLFFPMFIFSLIQHQFFSEHYENFWCIKLLGITLGLILIPILYYSYTGIFGVSKDWLNILIFFLSAAATYLFEIKLFNQQKLSCRWSLLALLVLCLYAMTFVILTYVPPQIPLFEEPNAKTFWNKH